MKVYFNRKVMEQPWGGGSVTVRLLRDYLISKNETVMFESDIFKEKPDIITMLDPRISDYGPDFTFIKSYKEIVDPNVKILMRIGDIGTHSKPGLTDMVIEANKIADHTVFVSRWSLEWLRNNTKFVVPKKHTIIRNAVDTDLFKPLKKSTNFVTTSWSQNLLKGFDFYTKFIESDFFKNGPYSYTFIGRCPEEFKVLLEKYKPKTQYIEPLSQNQLAEILPTFDVYLTATKLECGPNSVNEAISSRLKILYHEDGGAVQEYVVNHMNDSINNSFSFNDNNWEIIFTKAICKDVHRNIQTKQRMCEEYYRIMKEMTNG